MRRLVNLLPWRRRQLERDLDREIRYHVDRRVEDLKRSGAGDAEARRQVALEFGGVLQVKEEVRETWIWRWLDTGRRDLRDAARSLRRDRGATACSIGIAGVGIAASVTVFGVCQALLLRPLPLEEPQRLVWIANGTSDNLSAQTVQVSNLETLVAESRSFDGIAGFCPFYGPGDIRLTGSGDPERVTAVPVTQTLFSLLGVTPLVGRSFNAADSRDHAPRTAVLDFRFFQRRFAGETGIIGRSIVLDGHQVTVIGVLPPTFDFAATFTPGRRADLFVPFPLSPETNRQGNTLALIGRLKHDATIEQAQAEAASIASHIASGKIDGTWRNKLVPRLSPLRERISGRYRAALLALSGAVGFLMLLVCANLSTLMLVRASIRRREMAVRTALGASSGQLIRQMLVESLVLAAGGVVLGVALAWSATTVISGLQDTTIPLLNDVRVDSVALGFAVLLAVATGIGFGIVPAVQGLGFALSQPLSDDSRSSTGRRSGRLRRAVVVVEVALVCVLLTGAALLMRSLMRVLEVDPGFASDDVIALRVDPVRTPLTSAERRAYLDGLVRAVAGVPGVAAAGLTDALPLGDNFGWRRWSARASGEPSDAAFEPLVRMVDAGYFATMKIPLRAGRRFSSADAPGSEPVVIVNETLAARMWPGKDPIGRTMEAGGTARRVVGVVGPVRYFALDREVEGEIYMPLGHAGGFSSVDLVVRGSITPSALIVGLRAALRRADPGLPVANVRTMDELVDRSLFARRFVVTLVMGFAAFGLVLAALGLYAVISYSVSQRTREIGIRMALGGTAANIRAGILGETGRLALLGFALGLPLSWAAAQAIRSLLFDVRWSDPVAYTAVTVMLAGVAVLAGYLPARRATLVDPAIAFRPDR